MMRVHTQSLIAIFFTLFLSSELVANLSSLSRADPYPVYTVLDPQNLLLTKTKLRVRDPLYSQIKNDGVALSISPFGQNACRGRNLAGDKFFGSNIFGGNPECDLRIELGDLPAGCLFPGGRWSMIGLLSGPLPNGETLPSTLEDALNVLFPGQAPGTVDDPSKIDFCEELLGFFTVPLDYRKRGVRFEFMGNLLGGFGFKIQTGIASMSQTVTQFVDLNCLAQYDKCKWPCFPPNDNDPTMSNDFMDFQNNVEKFLMRELKNIASEIGLNICDFCEVSIEEIRMTLFWRDVYELNRDKFDWPHFLFIPFLEFGGSFSPGKRKDPCKQFSLGFGNNDHTAIGFTAGLNFDFIETIEIGGEVGVTHFFDRDFDCFRVPNSRCQSNFYPFATDVTISPGLNWHFGAKISAYHFLERLSFWFQYVMVEHKPDKICLKKPDSAFLPEILEDLSGFKVKVADIAFTYDISPNIGLGFLWQAPLGQRNAYRSSTVMGTFYTTF